MTMGEHLKIEAKDRVEPPFGGPGVVVSIDQFLFAKVTCEHYPFEREWHIDSLTRVVDENQ